MTGSKRSLRVLVSASGIEELGIEDQLVVIIDVLRACTVVSFALDAGARGVIPVETVEEASALAAKLGRDSVVLGGERRSVPVEGFDLGNSPVDYTREAIAGRTVILSTTNGTRAFARAASARECVAGAIVNRRAVARHAAGFDRILIVCSGQGGYFSFEDFLCAGLLIDAMLEEEGHGRALRDGARAALDLARRHRGPLAEVLAATDHGRDLAALGFAADLALAGDLDRFSAVPVLGDGRLLIPSR